MMIWQQHVFVQPFPVNFHTKLQVINKTNSFKLPPSNAEQYGMGEFNQQQLLV